MKHFRTFAAACSLAAILPAAGNASVVVNIEETSTGVVATYSGSIDTHGLIYKGHELLEAFIWGTGGSIRLGAHDRDLIYSGFSGPTSWGSGFFWEADSAAGDLFGVDSFYGYPRISLPILYHSGAALSGSAGFSGRTLAWLGLNKGQYVYTAGTQTVTVNIGVDSDAGAVPEPATWVMMIMGFGATGGALRRRQKVASRVSC